MRFRTAALLTVAAAVSVETAVAPAQTDSTRRASSTRRIRISKEASGEVVSRVDTVTIYRSDTVRVSRVDTVAGPSYTRVDTVRIEPPLPPPLRQIGGLYFGLAGGAAIPTGDLDNAQRGGPHFDGVLGWDPMNMPLGLRLDGSFSRFDVISQFESLSSSPTILQLGLDGKLHLPTIMPWPQRMQVYAVGGASWNRFKDLVESGDGAITVGN